MYVYNVVQLYTYNVTFVLIRTFVNFRTKVRVRVQYVYTYVYTYFRTFSTFVRKFSYFRTFVIEDFVKCHVADLHVRTVDYFRMILTIILSLIQDPLQCCSLGRKLLSLCGQHLFGDAIHT